MRIAVICSLYPPYIGGGAEISTHLLAHGLSDNGHEVHIITQGERDHTERNGAITIHRLKSRNIYWEYEKKNVSGIKRFVWHVIDIYNPFLRKPLARLLKEIQPDVVHTHNLAGVSCVAWDVAHLLHIPIVHTLRDYYLMCPRCTMMKGAGSCGKQCVACHLFSVMKKRMSQKVDAVVGISDYILKRHLTEGYFRNSRLQRRISNSVPIQQCFTRKSLGRTIGYIGRISPEKGIEFLIEAFMKSENKGATLLIAGTGKEDYVSQLKTDYENDCVRFLGKCAQSDFFPMIDLLVVPSLWNEPFGRVVIEAYSFHVPVLMANNGGLAELVESGISRSFFTHGTSSLTALLNDFFNNRMKVNDDMFDKVLRKYSSDKISGSYMELYNTFVNQISVKG